MKRTVKQTMAQRFLAMGAVVSIATGTTMQTAMAQPLFTIPAGVPATPPDTSKVPGRVITHIPAQSRIYIGSPGLVVLPDGKYLAKCDWFGPGSTQTKRGQTRVFVSSNKGHDWQWLADVPDLFWATIFTYQSTVYLLGTSKEYGDMVIRRSNDGGRTWTEAKDANSGLLRAGKYHCAPMPIIEHKGRLWRGFEDAEGTGGWGKSFRAFMMSIPIGVDLLKAQNWTNSNPIGRDATWNDNDFNGWLEGNAVVTPDGKIVDILRVDTKSPDEKAAVISISDDGKTSNFDPKTGFIPFPGGAKKFAIRFDPQTKLYWSLSNYIPPRHKRPGPASLRNTLALISSPDFHNWTVKTVLLYHPDTARHGFQYVEWLFEGDDIIYTSRTAYDDGLGGAHNNHDANFLTFHRAANFRRLTMADSVPMPEQVVMRYETRDLIITGTGFELASLGNNHKAFFNRAYVWGGVPVAWSNVRFTKLGGGVKADINVRAKQDTILYLATTLPMTGTTMATGGIAEGWTKAPTTFYYTDRGKSVMTILTRAIKAGEELSIPQSNWTGGLLLLPNDQAQ